MTHKFRAIRGLPLGTLLAAETGLPVYFLNDADVFGLRVGWRQLRTSSGSSRSRSGRAREAASSRTAEP